jgi:hypothetical protein
MKKYIITAIIELKVEDDFDMALFENDLYNSIKNDFMIGISYEEFSLGIDAQEIDRMSDIKIPVKPKPPLIRMIQMGEINFCDKCHSSIKTKWLGFKKLGCIQPECDNYYKRKIK